MLDFVYHKPSITPQDKHPCITCCTHGPYCADFCPLLDAWKEAQQARNEQKPASAPE